MSIYNPIDDLNKKIINSNTEDIGTGDGVNCVVYGKHTSSHTDDMAVLHLDNGHNLLVVDSQLQNVRTNGGNSDQFRVDVINTPTVNVSNAFATESTLSTINTTTADTLTLLDKCSSYINPGTHQLRCDIISNVTPTIDQISAGNGTSLSINAGGSNLFLNSQTLNSKRRVYIVVRILGADTSSLSGVRLQIQGFNNGSGSLTQIIDEIDVGKYGYSNSNDTYYHYSHLNFPFPNLNARMMNLGNPSAVNFEYSYEYNNTI